MFKLNSIVADNTTTCAVTANAPLQRSLSLQHLRLHFFILSELPSVYVPSLHFFSISSHIVFSMHARDLNFLPLSRSTSALTQTVVASVQFISLLSSSQSSTLWSPGHIKHFKEYAVETIKRKRSPHYYIHYHYHYLLLLLLLLLLNLFIHSCKIFIRF